MEELKVARSFIVDLDSNDRTERIVRSIIHLAHSLDLTVVAEGVEDESLAEHLLRLGVDYLQGYVIARPATSQLTTKWLESHPPTMAPDRTRPEKNRPLEILVVDEHPAARTALRKRLTERHHRVVEAHSGTAALEKLTKRMPDVIILDHLLPGLNGVQTAPRLREAGYTGPILLFSGYPPEGLATMRFPMDVWPVSKADDSTFMRLIDGYAGTPVPLS